MPPSHWPAKQMQADFTVVPLTGSAAGVRGYPGYSRASPVQFTTGDEDMDTLGPGPARLVAKGGIEPPTRGFSVRCSTN